MFETLRNQIGGALAKVKKAQAGAAEYDRQKKAKASGQVEPANADIVADGVDAIKGVSTRQKALRDAAGGL